jgi:hypothetical protein
MRAQTHPVQHRHYSNGRGPRRHRCMAAIPGAVDRNSAKGLSARARGT